MAPITNDLLLAAALTSAVPVVVAQPVTDAGRPQTGVATTVKTGAVRGASTTMYVDGATNQRLATDANSTMHVLFSDQSAVTLGPNSELVIAKYEFNAKARDGQILMDLTKGLLRVVGGLISKKTETVVRAGTATIGIRGGITIAETDGQRTSGTFLFGQGMRVTDNNGNTQAITRAGFGTSLDTNQPPSSPRRVSVSDLNNMLNRLETRPTGGNQGNLNPPPAPAGQLISTGNIPGAGNPGSTLANDRLKTLVDADNSRNPSPTLQALLGTGKQQIQS